MTIRILWPAAQSALGKLQISQPGQIPQNGRVVSLNIGFCKPRTLACAPVLFNTAHDSANAALREEQTAIRYDFCNKLC